MNILFENTLWIISFVGITIVASFLLLFSMKEKALHKLFIPIIPLVLSIVVLSIVFCLKLYNQNTHTVNHSYIGDKEELEYYKREYQELKEKYDFLESENELYSKNLYYTAEDGNDYIINLINHIVILSEIKTKTNFISIPSTIKAEENIVKVDEVLLNISKNDIEKVEIPNNTQSVNIYFSDCKNLTEIIFNDIDARNVCSISLNIEHCDSLRKISFPNCRSYIKRFSVNNCPSLESISISNDSIIDEEAIFFQPDSQNLVEIICDNRLIKQLFYE